MEINSWVIIANRQVVEINHLAMEINSRAVMTNDHQEDQLVQTEDLKVSEVDHLDGNLTSK